MNTILGDGISGVYSLSSPTIGNTVGDAETMIVLTGYYAITVLGRSSITCTVDSYRVTQKLGIPPLVML